MWKADGWSRAVPLARTGGQGWRATVQQRAGAQNPYLAVIIKIISGSFIKTGQNQKQLIVSWEEGTCTDSWKP